MSIFALFLPFSAVPLHHMEERAERRVIGRHYIPIAFFGRRTVAKRVVPGLVRWPRRTPAGGTKSWAASSSPNPAFRPNNLDLKLPKYLMGGWGGPVNDGANLSGSFSGFGAASSVAQTPNFVSPSFSHSGAPPELATPKGGGGSSGGGGVPPIFPQRQGRGGGIGRGLSSDRGRMEGESEAPPPFRPKSLDVPRSPEDLETPRPLPGAFGGAPSENQAFGDLGPHSPNDFTPSAGPSDPTYSGDPQSSSSQSNTEPTKFNFAFLHQDANGLAENLCGGTPAGKKSSGESCSYAFFLAAHCVAKEFTSMRLHRDGQQENYHTVPRGNLEVTSAPSGIDAALITFDASCDYIQDEEIARLVPTDSNGGPVLTPDGRLWTKNQDGQLIQGSINPDIRVRGKDSIVVDETSGPHSRPGDSGSPIWSSQGLVGAMSGGSPDRLDFHFSRTGVGWLAQTLMHQGFTPNVNHSSGPAYGSSHSNPEAMRGGSSPSHLVSTSGARPGIRDIASNTHPETAFPGTTDPRTGFKNAILPQLVPHTQGEHRLPEIARTKDPNNPLHSGIKNCILCHKAGSGRKLILPADPEEALRLLKTEMKRNCGFVNLHNIFKMADSEVHGRLDEDQKQALFAYLTGKQGDYRQIIEEEARALHATRSSAPPKIVPEDVDRAYRQLLPKTQDPFMNQIFNSGDTVMYDSKSMPLIYQIGKDTLGAGEGLKPVNNPNINEGFLGWADMFFNGRLRGVLGSPLGLHDTASENFGKFQFFKLPRHNGYLSPAIWSKVASGIDSHYYDWDFPIGTTFGEAITVKAPNGASYVTEVRVRTKAGRDYWQADIYRPFPTRQSLVDAVKRLWPNWEENSTLKKLVDKMESSSDLPVTTVSSKYGTPVYSDRAATDALNTLPPEIVSRLLRETPFQSSLNRKWFDNGKQVCFAPTSQSEFNLVPKNFAAHTTEVSSESCMRCHQNSRTNFGTLFPWARRNDGAPNAPPDAYGASYGSSSRIMTWHPFDDSAVNSNFTEASDNRERNGLPNFRRSLVDSGLLIHKNQVPSDLEGCY